MRQIHLLELNMKILVLMIILLTSPLTFASSDLKRTASEARYTKVVDSWVGADINQLIMSWGSPTSQYTMPNGNVVFIWVRSNTYADDGDMYTYKCTTEFFTRPLSYEIFSWKWSGNACRQRE